MSKGFTIIEIILSIAIITIILGISIPIYQSLQNKNDFDIAAMTLAQTLRRAQTLAESGLNDTGWGVDIANEKIILFRGMSYLNRNTDYDEIYTISNSINSSGISEIIFNKFTGLPQSTGTIILTSTSNEVKNITINEKGTIIY